MRNIMFIGIIALLMSGCSKVGEIDKNKIPGEKIYKLSTGREVALPLRYKNWKWKMATYTVPLNQIEKILPSKLKPVLMFPGKALISFGVLEYPHVSALKPYDEWLISIPVQYDPSVNIPFLPVVYYPLFPHKPITARSLILIRERCMLRVTNLDVAYGSFQVLWGVRLEITQGEIVSILGPNGAGKSTLMNTIARLVPVKGGSIEFFDEKIDHIPPYKIVSLGISHVLERRRVFTDMTVYENLLLGAYHPHAKKYRQQTLEWVLTLFPRLEERKDQLAGTMSGGEQQMLAIGRGLMARPKLLMADEPFLGLAPLIMLDIIKIMKKINFPLMTPGQEFREITDKELRATSVYAIQIEEWSGKENWKDRADQSSEWAPLDEKWFE